MKTAAINKSDSSRVENPDSRLHLLLYHAIVMVLIKELWCRAIYGLWMVQLLVSQCIQFFCRHAGEKFRVSYRCLYETGTLHLLASTI